MFRPKTLDLDAVPLAGGHEAPHRLAGQPDEQARQVEPVACAHVDRAGLPGC
jgi:hypothetical protein